MGLDQLASKATSKTAARIDYDTYRLRSFVEALGEAELERRTGTTKLAAIAGTLEANPKAVLFEAAGSGGYPLVGNALASRSRFALAFGVTPQKLLPEILRRLRSKPEIVEVSREEAPVQAVVMTGADIDLTKLPVHLQHGKDGGLYISAGMDFARDPATGQYNVGLRRFMLHGRTSTGIDLVAPSDLRNIYQAAIARGERLPLSVVVGGHPVDYFAATMRMPGDELSLLASLRAQPMPVVKCVSNDLTVPADAEWVLEGYLGEEGYQEPEGPYGEFLGYYGAVKLNPVFHLTAITRRKDALFQTATIGGRFLGRTDTAQLVAAKTEATIWSSLESAVREPLAVCCSASCGGMFNVRVSLRQRYPGEARNAIAAVFASVADVKNVFVVDDDIDVFDDGQIDWALATRFQADRDFVVGSNFRAVPIDPSLEGRRSGSKGGFDCTKPMTSSRSLEYAIPAPPVMPVRIHEGVSAALAAGPASFLDLMSAAGSRDGRDVLREIERLTDRGQLRRDNDGRYLLQETKV